MGQSSRGQFGVVLSFGRRLNKNMSDEGYEHRGTNQVPHNQALERTGTNAWGLSLSRTSVPSRGYAGRSACR